MAWSVQLGEDKNKQNERKKHPQIQSCWYSNLLSVSAHLKSPSETQSCVVLLVALRNARDPVRFTGHMTGFSPVLCYPQEATQIVWECENVVLTAYILCRSASSR